MSQIIYTSADTGKDEALGTDPHAPVKSLRRALELVAGGGEVWLTVGRYDGAVRVPSGVSIKGGYKSDADSWKQLLITDELLRATEAPDEHTFTILRNDAQDRVIEVDGASAEAALANLVVIGPKATPGNSSYGVVVRRGATLRLSTIKIVAGEGGPGVPGRAGGVPSTPESRLGGQGGPGGVSELGEFPGREAGIVSQYDRNHKPIYWIGYSSCISRPGTAGQSVTGASGGALGERGPVTVDNGSTRSTDPGHAGSSGEVGPAGKRGDAHLDLEGHFAIGDRLQWVASRAPDGVAGGGGAGGGGGGSGGCRHLIYFTGSYSALGGTGGGGGRGGHGGQGGLGGALGGGSFGLAIEDAKVVAEQLVIHMGHGGNGGQGGAGDPGEPGEPGHPGAAGGVEQKWTVVAGTGGAGGNGGDGGGGGDGAGGNGGVSVGVAVVGTGRLEGHPVSFIGGCGGQGGRGSVPGAAGFVAQKHVFRTAP
jgi:hypothetical protein